MPKILSLILIAVLVAIAAVACGDDDDNGDNGDDSTPSPTARATEEPEETPDEGNGEETPEPEDTPNGGDPTPEVTPTPPRRGTPATSIDDPQAWFAQNYPGVFARARTTARTTLPRYMRTAADGRVRARPAAGCPGRRVRAAASLNNEPIALRCTNAERITTAYYDIQE